MNLNKLRIATRTSPLALWQTNFVKDAIHSFYPDLEIELLGVVTTADKMLATPLSKIGGKGLFVKELETELLEARADIAVHSIKDMPMTLPQGLSLAVVCKREDPRDAFVSNDYASFSELPSGAIIGTSSLRRQAQLLAKRQDLNVKSLRGNVGTRLKKLDAKEFDAIVLASAGLKRLNENQRIKHYFSTEEMVPAAGQGAIGIECREDDHDVLKIISRLEDSETRLCILAERKVTAELGGSCQVPIASYAKIAKNSFTLSALVGQIDGSQLIKSASTVTLGEVGPIQIGKQVADDLIAQGAQIILNDILNSSN